MTFDEWKCLKKGTNKIRFEHCLDENNEIQYMRDIQGHAGAARIDLILQNHVLLLHGRSGHFCHVGSACRFECGKTWISKGKDDKHATLRQSIPWQHRCSLFDTSRINRERTNKNGVPRTMHHIGLMCGSRKNKGLEFWQTIDSAITLFDSIQTDCLDKVV